MSGDNARDMLQHIKWRPSHVPKPTLRPSTHSVDERGMTKMHPDPFLELLVRNEEEQYMSMQEMTNVIPLYEELCMEMESFINIYGADFDKEIIKSTSAVSLVKPNHTFLDEFGGFTLSVPSSIKLANPSKYLMNYETQVNDIRTVVASYPRGKNTGLPIIVSGSNRFTSNVVNVINLIAASVFQKWMYEKDFPTFKADMEELLKWMNEQFGYATSQVVFSRYQHIGKKVPVTFSDHYNQWFTSTNLFPRRRIINSTIKYIAMALKAAIKVMTEIDLNTPVFTQDRELINMRVAECYRNGGVVLAVDQSRFDLRHGGDKMVNLYDNIIGPRFSRVFGRIGEHLTYLSRIEAGSTTLIPTLQGVFAGSGEEVLKSGESATSRKGSWMQLSDDMTITREIQESNDEAVNDYFLKTQPSVILSDDLLKLFPSPDDADKYAKALPIICPKMGVGMDLEKPTKFLGQLIVNINDVYGNSPILKSYNGRVFDGPAIIQPMGSIIQKSVFPERFRSERYPTFAALIKMVIIPFNAIRPGEMAVHPEITDAYLMFCKNFLNNLGKIRQKYGNTKHEYFLKAAEHFPVTREAASVLYADLLKDPTKYGLDVSYDFDEILNALFKGLEFDVNWSVVGLELDQPDIIQGKLKDVTEELINEISPTAKASEFIFKLIRDANASYNPDPTFVKFLYDTVIRHHKLLGLRYSPGLPIY